MSKGIENYGSELVFIKRSYTIKCVVSEITSNVYSQGQTIRKRNKIKVIGNKNTKRSKNHCKFQGVGQCMKEIYLWYHQTLNYLGHHQVHSQSKYWKAKFVTNIWGK